MDGGDVAVESLRFEPHKPLIILPHLEFWPCESVEVLLYCPVLSPRFKERRRSSVAKLPLLPGLGPGPVPRTGRLEKCGMVVTGVTVDVVAALLFRVPRSLPGMGKLAVLIDVASEVRRS